MATMDFSMYGRQNTLMDYMNADKDRALKQRMGEQDIATQQQNMEMNKYKVEQDKLNNALQLLSGVSDEGSYQKAKQIASQRLGMDVSTLPPNYDPKWVAATQNQLLTAKERMDMAWEKQKFSQTLGETARHNRAIEDKPAGLGGQVAAQIMAENPGMGFTEAYLLGTAKQGQGMTWNPQTRRMELMRGAAPAAKDMSYAKATGGNLSDLQYKPQTENLVAKEREVGKAAGEAAVDLADREASLPQLEAAVSRLSELGKTATYTKVGQYADTATRQAGLPVRQAAVDRVEYISRVDNEILPLLRQTFGAQFTQKEGESLKVTLGDPDKSPQEKDAVLRSFIETKKATIRTKQRRIGASPSNTPTSKKWVLKDGQLVPAQ